MSLVPNLQLMSKYNQWMNQKIYQAAGELEQEQVMQDRGAFFGSIFKTLSHIWVADVIWLRRFASHPRQYISLQALPELSSYTTLDLEVATDLEVLHQLRTELDQVIKQWCEEITSADLNYQLPYQDTKNNSYCKNFGQLIQHFFNHQTHHRGQVSTLINQQGIDPGITDLLAIIPEESI